MKTKQTKIDDFNHFSLYDDEKNEQKSENKTKDFQTLRLKES